MSASPSAHLDHEAAWGLRRHPTEFAEAVENLPEGPETTVLRARVALVQGRLDEVLRIADDTEPRLDDRSVWRARLVETRGVVYGLSGLEEDARRHFRQAQQIYRAVGDAPGTASTMQNLATLRYQPTETVEQLLGEALEVARPTGAADLVGVILLNLSSAEIELGRPTAQIEGHLQESSEWLARAWPELSHKGLSARVRLLLDRGEPERAEALAEGLPPVETLRDPSTQASVALVLADLNLHRGRVDDAATALESLAFADLVPTDAPRVQHMLSRVREAQGRLPEALDAARQAYQGEAALRAEDSASASRALDAVHRTAELRTAQEQEQRRSAALAEALGELQEATARIQELSIHDPLTGLHNRQHLMDVGPDLLARATERAPAQVALIDLDRFKEVNDTLGHAAGDTVLRAFAGVLRRHLPSTDLVARYGGEEFVVVRPPDHGDRAPLAADLNGLRLVIRSAVDDPMLDVPPVTMSAGVTEAHDRLDDALTEADELMYAAKRAGGDRVRTRSPSSDGRPAGVREAGGRKGA